MPFFYYYYYNLCRGCNPILQTGEYPQICGSGWHPRPCAQSMRIPNSRGFYRHFQFFPLSVCGSLMLQKIHHCAHTKEKHIITCLIDWRPVALTPIFSKCFEKLIRDYICSVPPASLDPLQFAFNLYSALSHLENKNTNVRVLFMDYSSAFNNIVPATLVAKLQTLRLNRPLCSWILDFLTGRSHVVRMGNNTSSPLILNTGAPQGCILSPLLYSLYTHDCTVTQLQRHCQICWWHNGDRPEHWQRWDDLQRGGEYPDKMVSGEPPLTQHRQDQGAGGGLQKTEQRTHTHHHRQDTWGAG